MDAVEFLKAAERRMKSNPDYYEEFINLHDNDWVALVAQVEQWAKEHPAKTRQSEFLKMFPNALLDREKIIHICPCSIDKTTKCLIVNNTNCYDCRRIYWLQGVE